MRPDGRSFHWVGNILPVNSVAQALAVAQAVGVVVQWLIVAFEKDIGALLVSVVSLH